MAIALSILTILAAIVPVVMDLLKRRGKESNHATEALVQRDLDVLATGLDQLRKP